MATEQQITEYRANRERAIELLKLETLSIYEISERLGIKADTVRKIIYDLIRSYEMTRNIRKTGYHHCEYHIIRQIELEDNTTIKRKETYSDLPRNILKNDLTDWADSRAVDTIRRLSIDKLIAGAKNNGIRVYRSVNGAKKYY